MLEILDQIFNELIYKSGCIKINVQDLRTAVNSMFASVISSIRPAQNLILRTLQSKEFQKS